MKRRIEKARLKAWLFLAAIALAAISCRSLAEELTPDLDSSVPCGDADELCCTSDPACGESMICVNGVDEMAPENRYCLLECVPPICENVAGHEGTCSDIGLPGGGGACLVDEDFSPTDCQEGYDGCETPSGATVDTICLSDGQDNYCFEICQVVDEICDDSHTCVVTSDGSGGCLPD